MKEQNPLEKLIASGWAPSPGELVEITVLHDDWCHKLNGRGACNCDPDVDLVATQKSKTS